MGRHTTVWYIKPRSDGTNEQIAAALAALGEASCAETVIVVNGTEERVYRVRHKIVTDLGRSEHHRGNFRVFVQEGGGAVREWNLQGARKKIARTKKYREAEKATRERTGKK